MHVKIREEGIHTYNRPIYILVVRYSGVIYRVRVLVILGCILKSTRCGQERKTTII